MNMNPTITDDNGRIVEYGLSLTADETQDWADERCWLDSIIAGHKLRVCINENGLCECLVDGDSIEHLNNIDNNELTAIVADHLPKEYRHLWPTWADKKERDKEIKINVEKFGGGSK